MRAALKLLTNVYKTADDKKQSRNKYTIYIKIKICIVCTYVHLCTFTLRPDHNSDALM